MKGATRNRGRRGGARGVFAMGAAAAKNSSRFLNAGSKTLNRNNGSFRLGRTRSYDAQHNQNRIAPISKGKGLVMMGAAVAGSGAKAYSGQAGPLNQV